MQAHAQQRKACNLVRKWNDINGPGLQDQGGGPIFCSRSQSFNFTSSSRHVQGW